MTGDDVTQDGDVHVCVCAMQNHYVSHHHLSMHACKSTSKPVFHTSDVDNSELLNALEKIIWLVILPNILWQSRVENKH